jgi:hypothetical protein
MQKVDELALISIGRGVGFAALGIATLMLALSWDIMSCMKAGGILTLMTSLTLLMKAYRAPLRDYRRTEVWIMMAPAERPSDAIAQGLIGEALQRTCLLFALHTSGVAGVLLLFATLLDLAALTR